MSHQSTFTGADFVLKSVTQIANSAIRIRFTQDPLAANPTGANDGLNPSHYTLTGPGSNFVTVVSVVPDDPQSLDLTLKAPLVAGTWTLSISSNLQTATGRPLQEPRALAFTVTILSNAEPVNGGANNDSAESLIRKHLSPALRGKAWDALIAALAIGDRLNWDNAVAAFSQLFKSSASGLYLDRKCGDDGIDRPPNIGMSDDLYRRLGIKVTTQKLIEKVLLEILEIFYGSDSLKAYVQTEVEEPFSLTDGDVLNVVVDEQAAIPVVFRSADFSQIAQAKAIEVAAAITRQLSLNGSKGTGLAVKDPVSGKSRVRIYSGALGLSSSVRIGGGIAQKGLKFETQVVTPPPATDPATLIWDLTIPQAGTLRLKITGASALDMNQLQIGDYVVITGSTFNAANRGSYEIKAVDVRYVGATLEQYIEVLNDAAVAQAGIAQVQVADVLFFRPTKKTIHFGGTRTVVVAQDEAQQINVVMPAITQAVNRTLKTGAYPLLRTALGISSMIRRANTVTVTTSSAHGLAVGNQVLVEEVYGGTAAPTVIVGDLASAGNPGTTSASLATIWSPVRAQDGQSVIGHSMTRLQDGKILLVGGEYYPGPVVTAATQRFELGAPTTLANGEVQYSYNWLTSSNMATARAEHIATLLTSGRVFVAGGWDGIGDLLTSEIYEPLTNAWTAGPAVDPRRAAEAQLLDDGQVIFFGGELTAGTILATSQVYNPATGTVGSGPTMITARSGFASVKLKDGRILAIGGWDGSDRLATCEIVTPGGEWARTGSMTYKRSLHRAILLDDGRVLVIGGLGKHASWPSDSLRNLAEAEIYDPSTGTWFQAGKMKIGRRNAGVALTKASGGMVAVSGGVTGASTDESLTEYYDQKTGKWRLIPGNLSDQIHDLAVSMRISDGIILSLGGDASITKPTPHLLVQANDSYSAGDMNGIFKVESAPTSTTFTYKTRDTRSYTSNANTALKIYPVGAITHAGMVGPYIIDPEKGLAITAVKTTTTQATDVGSQYTVLNVADASAFPDEEGWLVIGFGTDTAAFPIRYLGRFSATALILDYQQKLPASNPSGASVTLLHYKGIFEPMDPEDLGLLYITASPAGRVAAEAQLRAAVAAGIDLNLEVVYPGDRGLGNEAQPATGSKISDKVVVWGGDDLDTELAEARGED